MPLEGEHAGEIGLETSEGLVCKFDVKDGVMKSPQEIFEGGVGFFMQAVSADKDLAERVTRKNMKSLPYWQTHPFAELEGPVASDEEFADAMNKL